jgi:hypothetical protein
MAAVGKNTLVQISSNFWCCHLRYGVCKPLCIVPTGWGILKDCWKSLCGNLKYTSYITLCWAGELCYVWVSSHKIQLRCTVGTWIRDKSSFWMVHFRKACTSDYRIIWEPNQKNQTTIKPEQSLVHSITGRVIQQKKTRWTNRMAPHHSKIGSEIQRSDHLDQAYNYQTIWLLAVNLFGFRMFSVLGCPVFESPLYLQLLVYITMCEYWMYSTHPKAEPCPAFRFDLMPVPGIWKPDHSKPGHKSLGFEWLA